jgi:hypothetical protein
MHVLIMHVNGQRPKYPTVHCRLSRCHDQSSTKLLHDVMLGSGINRVVDCDADYKTGDMAEPEGEMYSRALNMLLPYLLSWRTRLARADAAQQSPSPVKTRAAPSKAEGEAVQPSSPAAGAGAADSAAQSPSAQVRAGGQQQAPQAASPPARPREQLDLQRLTASQRHHLAVLLDTALLKVRPLSLRFVQCCHVALHSSSGSTARATLQDVPTCSGSQPCPG